MKKVLILAYDFPPYVSVGGLRPYSWYKYLHEFGLYPVVVTRQWGNKYGNHLDYVAAGESDECIVEETEHGTIIRSPYKPNLSNRLLLKYGENRFKIIRKIITAFYEFAQWFFFIGPKVGLYKGAEEYLKKNKVDCIIATGEPFVLFRYASKLSQKYNLPWLADYRDPWSQNRERSSDFFSKKRNYYFEKKILNSVTCITTVSEYFMSQIKENIKDKPYEILTNGFSLPVNFSEVSYKPDSKFLSISFVGTIYQWHPWKQFLNVINKIKKDKDLDIGITFYGINNQNEIEKYVQEFCLEIKRNMFFVKKMDNEKLMIELKKHHLLLLFNYYTFVGTKIYDYLAIRRRILLCFINDLEANLLRDSYFPLEINSEINQNLQEDIIKETNSGYSISNQEHLYDMLIKLQNELVLEGELLCNSVGVEKFSRRSQVEKMSKLLKSIFKQG